MKNYSLLAISLFIAFHSLGQKKISDLDSIAYTELSETFQSKEYKNRVNIKNYQLSNGKWLSIGDTLIIGKPSNENNLEQNQYIGGSTNNHSFIFLGTDGAALMGTMFMANENMQGDVAIITELKMARIGRNQPFEVAVYLNKADGSKFLNVKNLARAYLEKALNAGELIDPNSPMTREEAIKKLKEAKDLLELEMLTQEEFDLLKKELAPIIKGEN